MMLHMVCSGLYWEITFSFNDLPNTLLSRRNILITEMRAEFVDLLFMYKIFRLYDYKNCERKREGERSFSISLEREHENFAMYYSMYFANDRFVERRQR